jgi:hypothetical protein
MAEEDEIEIVLNPTLGQDAAVAFESWLSFVHGRHASEKWHQWFVTSEAIPIMITISGEKDWLRHQSGVAAALQGQVRRDPGSNPGHPSLSRNNCFYFFLEGGSGEPSREPPQKPRMPLHMISLMQSPIMPLHVKVPQRQRNCWNAVHPNDPTPHPKPYGGTTRDYS